MVPRMTEARTTLLTLHELCACASRTAILWAALHRWRSLLRHSISLKSVRLRTWAAWSPGCVPRLAAICTPARRFLMVRSVAEGRVKNITTENVIAAKRTNASTETAISGFLYLLRHLEQVHGQRHSGVL